nr:MAG TPA: hypothetical protein [Caudoviricetes sp.]
MMFRRNLIHKKPSTQGTWLLAESVTTVQLVYNSFSTIEL